MFELIGDDAQRERLDPSLGFLFGGAVGEDARKVRDLGYPPAVGFALNLNREGHSRILIKATLRREAFRALLGKMPSEFAA